MALELKLKRTQVLISCAVALRTPVSVTGGISFIGLMAPHIAKSLVYSRHQIFMPIALLIGGWLLLLADTIGRNIVDPNGIPAGIVVALIGAPYFMYLLLKSLKTPSRFLEGVLFHSTLPIPFKLLRQILHLIFGNSFGSPMLFV